jgi:hypothetical protein
MLIRFEALPFATEASKCLEPRHRDLIDPSSTVSTHIRAVSISPPRKLHHEALDGKSACAAHQAGSPAIESGLSSDSSDSLLPEQTRIDDWLPNHIDNLPRALPGNASPSVNSLTVAAPSRTTPESPKATPVLLPLLDQRYPTHLAPFAPPRLNFSSVSCEEYSYLPSALGAEPGHPASQQAWPPQGADGSPPSWSPIGHPQPIDNAITPPYSFSTPFATYGHPWTLEGCQSNTHDTGHDCPPQQTPSLFNPTWQFSPPPQAPPFRVDEYNAFYLPGPTDGRQHVLPQEHHTLHSTLPDSWSEALPYGANFEAPTHQVGGYAAPGIIYPSTSREVPDADAVISPSPPRPKRKRQTDTNDMDNRETKRARRRNVCPNDAMVSSRWNILRTLLFYSYHSPFRKRDLEAGEEFPTRGYRFLRIWSRPPVSLPFRAPPH